MIPYEAGQPLAFSSTFERLFYRHMIASGPLYYSYSKKVYTMPLK